MRRLLARLDDWAQDPGHGKCSRFAGSHRIHHMCGKGCSSPNALFPMFTLCFEFSPAFPPGGLWGRLSFLTGQESEWRRGKSMARHGSFVEGTEYFDNKFFGLSPLEAKAPKKRGPLTRGIERYNAVDALGVDSRLLQGPMGGPMGLLAKKVVRIVQADCLKWKARCYSNYI